MPSVAGVTPPRPAAVETGPRPGTPVGPRAQDAAPAGVEMVVLDTSALVADPEGILDARPGAELVIPLCVIEELDGLKKRLDPVGMAARDVLRRLERLRRAPGGRPRRWPREAGGCVRVELDGDPGALVAGGLDPSKADNRILAVAVALAATGPVSVLSNDAALRVKAAVLGLDADEHDPLRTGGVERPRGWRELAVGRADIEAVYAGEDPPAVRDALGVQEFAVLRAGSSSALVRRHPGGVRPVPERTAWGLRPRNAEQRFALDLLCDPEVTVVALDGPAGTGKTLLAVAAGLQQVVEEGRYSRLCVYRPVVPVGKADLGYLPGTLDEKLDPWMAAVTDAVYALTDRRSRDDATRVLEEVRARGQLTMESVTHLRGRTLHSSYVLVDEAMNLSPQVGRTILTRIADDSKVVFTGDTSQIDAAFLSEQTNALTALVCAFAGQACFGHVHLSRGERSPLAELAARLL